MAMHPSLPFEVRLLLYDRHDPVVFTLRDFTTDLDKSDIDRTYLVEYVDCDLEFVPLMPEIPADARLYVDGLDALVDPQVKADDDRPYISCATRVPIQRHDETKFPWIPGNYRVEVRWNGRSYHTVLNVKPKDLTDDQLRTMREELEKYVVGLTLDLIRKNQGMGRSEIASKLPLRFYQYQLFESNFSRIHALLLDIVKRPKHEVQRVYNVTSNTVARRDQKSYRWLHSAAGYARNQGEGGANGRYTLAPGSVVQYDLSENRWTKRIVNHLIHMMNDISDAITDSLNEAVPSDAKFMAESKNQLATIQRLQSRLRAVLEEPFFSQVDDSHQPLPYTPAMQLDGRYRTLYRFWRDLMEHGEVRVNASFEYQWKKTDLLWEYWSLVRTIETLQRLGFEPVSGWIYDENWRFPERIYIPEIPEGTTVTMCRGNEVLKVHYENQIPSFRDEAKQLNSLMYVEARHNIPDIRIDYIKRERFGDEAVGGHLSGGGQFEGGHIGGGNTEGGHTEGDQSKVEHFQFSVVIDAKYRKARHIWSQEDSKNRDSWTRIMNQLQAYRSSVFRTDDPERRAVREVIALYPGDPDLPPVYNASDGITLIQLVPGQSDEHFTDYLAKFWGTNAT